MSNLSKLKRKRPTGRFFISFNSQRCCASCGVGGFRTDLSLNSQNPYRYSNKALLTLINLTLLSFDLIVILCNIVTDIVT